MILTVGMLEKTMQNIKENGVEHTEGIYVLQTEKDEIVYFEKEGIMSIYERGGYTERKQKQVSDQRKEEIAKLLMNDPNELSVEYTIQEVFRFEDIFWKWYQLICEKKGIKGITNIVAVENDSFWWEVEALKERGVLEQL